MLDKDWVTETSYSSCRNTPGPTDRSPSGDLVGTVTDVEDAVVVSIGIKAPTVCTKRCVHMKQGCVNER